ncbi:MAG: STELLO glycosyltransferase family protein [Bacteroidota bacterium]
MENIKNTYIIITTINPPTKAVKTFASYDNYQLVVVGDKKTTLDWSCPPSIFLPTETHDKLGFQLGKYLPFNHYGRKMIGYLRAIQQGAQCIIDTDDDNIPKDKHYAFPAFKGYFDTFSNTIGYANVYSYYTDKPLWPRGFPLPLLRNLDTRIEKHDLKKQQRKIGIWQGLADGDPDVDAIYRLIDNTPCHFLDKSPIVLEKEIYCPFNSQNTAFIKPLFPLLYLPAYVTFRFTDILRGLVAQPIMQLYGYHLGFTKATVFQERNPHDYLKDFESEIPCFLYAEKVINAVKTVVSNKLSIEENLLAAYKELIRVNIVPEKEEVLLEAWFADLKELDIKMWPAEYETASLKPKDIEILSLQGNSKNL